MRTFLKNPEDRHTQTDVAASYNHNYYIGLDNVPGVGRWVEISLYRVMFGRAFEKLSCNALWL